MSNKLLLETAARILNGFKGPWIAQGGWNMAPETSTASKWLEMVNGVVSKTQLPTYNDNLIMYRLFRSTQKSGARDRRSATA